MRKNCRGPRDVDQYVAGLRRLFGSEPPESQVAEYRRRPKHWHRQSAAADDQGRLWIATNRDWYRLYRSNDASRTTRTVSMPNSSDST